MKTKIVVVYSNGEEKVVYDGEFTPAAMQLQGKWVLKAKKNPQIKAVLWK